MRSPALEYAAAALVLLLPALGGVYVGLGSRPAARLRALSASAFLLVLAGCGGVALVTTFTGGGRPTIVLGFLALWLGVVLGTLVAMLGCVAGLAHAVSQRSWAWCWMLGGGALLPLVVAVLLLTEELGPRRGLTLVQLPAGPTSLVAILLLIVLAPLVTMIYGLSVADEDERPTGITPLS